MYGFRHQPSAAVTEQKKSFDAVVNGNLLHCWDSKLLFCLVGVFFWWKHERSKQFWGCYHWTARMSSRTRQTRQWGTGYSLGQAARPLAVLWSCASYVNTLLPSVKLQLKLEKTILTKVCFQSGILIFSAYRHISTKNAATTHNFAFFNVIYPKHLWK